MTSIASSAPGLAQNALLKQKNNVVTQHQVGQQPTVRARFGRDVADFYSKPTLEGVFVTPAPPESKTGGLEEVSGTIPEMLNTHLDMDIRRLEPMLAPVKATPGFKDTHIRIYLDDDKGKKQEFKIFQKLDKEKNTIIYAIDNQKYFGQYQNMFFYQSKHPDVPPDKLGKMMIESVSMFNRAAAAFLPKLDEYSYQNISNLVPNQKKNFLGYVQKLIPKEQERYSNVSQNPFLLALGKPEAAKESDKTSALIPFRGKTDVVWANDWHTGKLLSMLPNNNYYNPLKVFMLHNHLDYGFSSRDAGRYKLRSAPSGFNYYSPLGEGIKTADALIGNYNYLETLTKTGLMGQNGEAEPRTYIAQHLKNKTAYDIHHAISDEYSPVVSPHLTKEGFVQLKTTGKREVAGSEPVPETTPDNMREFKAANKAALQKKLHLNVDPDAPLFIWVQRFEPYQKGTDMVVNNAEAFLKKHPKAQIIMMGKEPFGETEDTLTQLRDNPKYEGRVCVRIGFQPQDLAVQTLAAADFFMMPSTYEPFGLTQLEAMKMGTIPVANPVDGIRSTVSDPEVNATGSIYSKPEKVWEEPQNGILARYKNFIDYREVLRKQNEPANDMELMLSFIGAFKMRTAPFENNFRKAMDRAVELSQDPDKLNQVRLNAFDYVHRKHNAQAIAHRYEAILSEAYKKKFESMPSKPDVEKPEAEPVKAR